MSAKRIIGGGALFGTLAYAAHGLMPFHDDWIYATAPNPAFEWSQLLPGAAFWRPFDVLWGVWMSKVPDLFPIANRLAIACAHTISTFLVNRVLYRISVDRHSCTVGTLFFALSSVTAAMLFNSDAINQAWSFALGIVALCVALGRDDVSRRRWCAVSGLILLSMLFKENGASWLAAVPLILYWRERNRCTLFQRAVFGAGVLAIYFALRFALMGEIAVGDGDYYAIGFRPADVVLNFAIAVFLPLSQFDMLAFACGHWMLFLLSIVLSVVFWTSLAVSSGRDEIGLKVSLFCLLALAFAAPHCFFKGHHPAEMHFYPVLFAGSVFIASMPVEAGRFCARCCGLVSMLLLFSCGWYDKLTEVRRRSEMTRALFLEIASRDIDFSKPVYFIAEERPDLKRYSVFAGSAGHGLCWGKACRAMNGWRDFDCRLVTTLEQRSAIPCGAQTVSLE